MLLIDADDEGAPWAPDGTEPSFDEAAFAKVVLVGHEHARAMTAADRQAESEVVAEAAQQWTPSITDSDLEIPAALSGEVDNDSGLG